MREILAMLRGKREAEWNHTATLVLVVQRAAGNKQAKFQNPFAVRGDPRDQFKKIFRGEKPK